MIPEYVDDDALREQDQVELDRYLKATDRAEDWPAAGQPFFSGREAQINAFRAMLDVMLDGRRANLAFVAHGAPGAGKSALLSQLVADMDDLPTSGGKPWLPVEIPRSAAASPHAVERAANRAMADRLSRRGGAAVREAAERAQATLQSALGGPLGESGVREEASDLFQRLREQPLDLPQADALGDQAQGILAQAGSGVHKALHAVMRRGFGAFGVALGPAPGVPDEGIMDVVAANPALWQEHRVVLFIDEAQNLKPGSESARELLETIYQGRAGAAVGLCFGGLPDTKSVLGDMGISRLPSGRTPRLGPLRLAEAETAIRRAFRQFRVCGGEGWIAPLAERSFGWPQHLQRHLTAALEVIRDADMDAGCADFAKAVQRGDRLREAYYHDRVESMSAHEDEVALVAQAFRDASRQWLPNRDLAAAAGLSENPSAYSTFRQAAIRAGLLIRGEGPGEPMGHYKIAIPSFGAFLRGEPPEPIRSPSAPNRTSRRSPSLG